MNSWSKLTDFGLADFLAAGGCSGSASAGGFLPYMYNKNGIYNVCLVHTNDT